MQIVECVPNFSEGRDQKVIARIADAIRAVTGVRLLDIDPGEATNRTVVTFVGPPSAVQEAAFAGIQRAAELIDMRRHQGAHARQGATDVCPFVPVSGVTMEDCVALARTLGERVGRELGLPVYLYGEAASRPDRRLLQDVRAGEYEGLARKLATPAGTPDYGPADFNATAGATAIGARKFLIAYNINLNTSDSRIAKAIAWRIRDSEGPVRGEDGKLRRGPEGKLIKKLGLFKHCKATGWTIAEYGCAQVTMNLTDWEESPLHDVFDACCRLADHYGVRVTGSEIVGLVPRAALQAAGAHFAQRQGASPGAPSDELIQLAVRTLGLNELTPFDPQKKIVEETLRDETSLAEKKLRHFLDLTSAGTAVPGGGSVAALSASLSAGLLAMVANLSVGARGLEDQRDAMGRLAQTCQSLKEELLQTVDRDAAAYASVTRALRQPKKTEEEKALRERAVAAANLEAALVPLSVLERTIELLDHALALVDSGLPSCLSDAAAAAAQAAAAADGACYNVLINLPGIPDQHVARNLRQRANDLHQRAQRLAEDVRHIVLGRLQQ